MSHIHRHSLFSRSKLWHYDEAQQAIAEAAIATASEELANLGCEVASIGYAIRFIESADQVWINPPHSVPDSAIVPAETQLAAQKASTTSLNGHNSSSPPAVEGPLSPAWEEKCSLFSINELSQIA